MKQIEPTLEPEQDKTLTDWMRPIPFTQTMESATPHPSEALPNILQKAVTVYQQYGQQPLPLVDPWHAENLRIFSGNAEHRAQNNCGDHTA